MAEPSAHEADLTQGRPLLMLLLASVIGVPVICLVLWWVLLFLTPETGPAVFEPQAYPTGPAPELQVHPIADFEALHRQQQERLNSLGWVNREEGIGHLPIERAMTLLAERGLESAPHRHSGDEAHTGEDSP